MTNYTSEDIKTLGHIQHIQLNPGMYIGETSNPVHLIEEVLDNSLDECLSGYGNIICIMIDSKKHIFSIMDNGRGIPIDNDVPITISAELFSGAKFKTLKTAYECVAGLHGVGLVAVNALSEWYMVDIYRDNKHASFTFEKGKIKSKNISDYSGEIPYSTKISFKPLKRIFGTLTPDIDRITKRLMVASAELENCSFILCIDDKKKLISVTKDEYFKNHCLDKQNNTTTIINTRVDKKPEKLQIKLCYSLEGNITPKVLSSVNLLHVDSGGTHVNYLYDIIKRIFLNKAKKSGIKIQPNDCLCGLRAYISLSLVEPEFSGQTKDRLINKKEYLDKLFQPVEKQLDAIFDKDEELTKSILKHFEDYRKKMDSKKIKVASHSKRGSTKFTKLRDCTSNRGALFVCEGDSAEGALLQCRDPRSHAIFPLRGKIPSIANAKDILKNKEIGELINALGTGVGPNFDITKLKYDKIVCACDADPDGFHIFCLLTIALANLVPDILKNDHYYLAHTPLYAINEGKTFIPLWTQPELQEAKNNNRKILRMKGLGEMNGWQLKIAIIDEDTKKWIKVDYTNDLDKIMSLFTDVQSKRNLLNEAGGNNES